MSSQSSSSPYLDVTPTPSGTLLSPAQGATLAISSSANGNGINGNVNGKGTEEQPKKPKTTRGARACMVCRRLKMRCVPRNDDGVDVGPPCKRCFAGNHDCIFEESQRGKRNNKKQETMASSLRKMEQTLDVVLKSISHPGVMASSAGMINTPALSSLSLSPSTRTDVPLDPRLEDGTSEFGPVCRGRSTSQAASLRAQSREKPQSPRLHSLPDNVLNPLGLLAEASLQNSRHAAQKVLKETESPLLSNRGEVAILEDERKSEEDILTPGKRPVGLASKAYFLPTAMNILPLRRVVIESRLPPAILTEKIVSIDEAVALFRIYFEHVNIHNPVLDADFHTPTLVGSRSPFLFTVICAIAARFYTKRKDLYTKCLTTAKKVAFEVLNKGWKSVEIVQGFTLLSLWNQPAERFEEDRTWTFLGIAIRMCTDLNLHRKSNSQLPDDSDEIAKLQFEREILNRERTWLSVWIQDRSLSAQMGKPYSIPKEDFIIRNSRYWHQQRASLVGDVGMVAMVQMHRINTRILDTIYSDTTTPSGLNVHLDYDMLVRTFSMQMDAWRDDWSIEPSLTIHSVASEYWRAMRMFYYHYYKLLLFSFGFQNALDKRENENEMTDLNGLFLLCFENAKGLIRVTKDNLAPRGHLRYAHDAQFVFLSYAAVFLLKCNRPDFTQICSESTLLGLVQEVVDALEEAAVDETHTPALYGRFIKSLLEGRRGTGTRAGTREGSVAVEDIQTNSLGLEMISEDMDGHKPVVTNSNDAMDLDAASHLIERNGNVTLAGFESEMDSLLDQQGLWNNFLFPGFGSQFELSAGGAAFKSLSMDPMSWDTPAASNLANWSLSGELGEDSSLTWA